MAYQVEITRYKTGDDVPMDPEYLIDRSMPMEFRDAWERRNRDLQRVDQEHVTASIVNIETGVRF